MDMEDTLIGVYSSLLRLRRQLLALFLVQGYSLDRVKVVQCTNQSLHLVYWEYNTNCGPQVPQVERCTPMQSLNIFHMQVFNSFCGTVVCFVYRRSTSPVKHAL